MRKRYDKEKIHKIFLEAKGNINLVMRNDGMPKTRQTIIRYAKAGGWYKELAFDKENSGNDCGVLEDNLDGIDRLEKVRSTIYRFLVPKPSEDMDKLDLKPKTYTEAVKCYLDVDSRIDEKRDKPSGSGTAWEDIMRECMKSDE